MWLGILTSISPCPLATNIAAISFLSKKITHPALVFISGLAYTLGRMAAYAVLGWVIMHSILSVPQAAQFLEKYMTKALGPILVIIGLVLLEVFAFRMPGISLSDKDSDRLSASGAPGAFLLGVIFALAFCPVSAALFFGSLIPMALGRHSGILLPVVYGAGTGLPVFLFAVAIAAGATSLNRWFGRVTRSEAIMRKATGVIFILAGSYYTAIYILRLF